jgi:glycosyltransferase involved in cell wall biosynthesis
MVIARLTTVRISLALLINGQSKYFRDKGHLYFLASGPCSYEFDDKFYTELPLVRRPSFFKDIYSLFATYCWLRKIRPDILHTHTPKAGLIGMIAGFLAGVPVRIHTVAGIPWINSKGGYKFAFRNIERLTYSFATKIYPNSRGLHQFLINEIPSAKDKYKVLGSGSSNGIDTNYFSIDAINDSKQSLRHKFNITFDSFVWLYVGRIVKDKGIVELVNAFLRMGPYHTLLMVGPFEDDQDPLSEETISLINSSPNIHTFGFQNDVRPFYKLSDALIFPSYREGFPNVPMQAAAMGLPQICTDINGCNEIVIPEVNGLLVPVKDVDALTKSMRLLYEDIDLRQSMILNSRKTIMERYSQLEIWRLIEEEYNNLLK